MARDRKGAQLSFELPPELFERLRAHAAAERRTMAALLRRWIEAGLAGALEPSAEPSAALVSLANRVETLEREVAQLQAGALRVPLDRGQLEIIGAKHLQAEPASPDRVIPAPPAGDAITTAELAARTGTNRAAWNNWAAADRIGQVRAHPEAGSWRLVGKAPAPGGGPERWLWEPA
jgi:predicted transcriptional regulator